LKLVVKVLQYHSQVTANEIYQCQDKLALRNLRRNYADKWFANAQKSNWDINFLHGKEFQWYVNKYAEITVNNPWDDVSLYFLKLNRLASNSQVNDSFYYPSHFPVVNDYAISAAAEALAGRFYQEYYGWSLIARPIRKGPDFIFREMTSKRWVLAEVCSSVGLDDTHYIMTSHMTNMLLALSNMKYVRLRPYLVTLAMVQLTGPSEVFLTNLLLEEV
jgi:hypothetical protein